MYAVLQKLVVVKPDFIFSMGRPQQDFLPPIDKLCFRKIEFQEYDSFDKKLVLQMIKFLKECQ